MGGLEEGARYWAAVRCGGGAGGAGLTVPEYGRLRGVAAGAAAAALLLAALGGALYASRRRLCARAAPPPAYPHLDKRRR